MRVKELLEGRLYKGRYDTGNYPTSRDKGLAHLYNNVIPELSRVFKVPAANFKVQSNHGYGFQPGRSHLYSIENVNMRVVLRKKDLDVDMIARLLPKLLKHELSKQLVNVQVSSPVVTSETIINDGRDTRVPPTIDLSFSASYPADWLEFDRRRYGIGVSA